MLTDIVRYRQPVFKDNGDFYGWHVVGFDNEGTYTGTCAGNYPQKYIERLLLKCTGLEDSIGTLVYYGDIVETPYSDALAKSLGLAHPAYELIVDNMAGLIHSIHDCVVRGNLIENRELIDYLDNDDKLECVGYYANVLMAIGRTP